MRALFYAGLILLLVFEILKVYLIMPMPGSQEMNSVDVAYFLHGYRWHFRIVAMLLLLLGVRGAFPGRGKWVALTGIALVLYVTYLFNFEMLAERMFRQPVHANYETAERNIVNDSSLVIAVSSAGESKAYPIRYILYHHQVRDTVGGRPIMVTYCNVCRTGRVFDPTVNGHPETFRLVGMDHYNAMFEDATTGSWWRQATGEAVAGPLRGKQLQEVESEQMTLRQWFALFPEGRVMQPDPADTANYDMKGRFEQGLSSGRLTRRDTASWGEKSWVVGVRAGAACKAYDWNRLLRQRVVNDELDGSPVVVALASDNQRFVAFVRPSADDLFFIRGDTLVAGDKRYDLSGRDLGTLSAHLDRLPAYQEYWHSWRTFHPNTAH